MLTNEQNIGVWNVIKSKSANLCRVLRKQMFDYCKVVNKGQRDLIMMDMIRRVECNSYSIMLLSEQSLQGNGSTYLKLPVGLLLRTCISDCLMGLYVSLLSQDELTVFVQSLNKDYVVSLLPRVVVYKDKVSALGFTDEFIENLYLLQLEDTYYKYLSFDKTTDEFTKIPMWNIENKCKTITLKGIVDILKKNEYTSIIAQKLFAYYKYFSQYEHFSESGYGDALVDFGNDNISFEKALDNLQLSIDMILKDINSLIKTPLKS